jgi:hypothetical protein
LKAVSQWASFAELDGLASRSILTATEFLPGTIVACVLPSLLKTRKDLWRLWIEEYF